MYLNIMLLLSINLLLLKPYSPYFQMDSNFHFLFNYKEFKNENKVFSIFPFSLVYEIKTALETILS